MEDQRVKGSHIIQAAQWVDQRLGKDAFKELTKSFAGPRWGVILPGTWYEVEVLQKALSQVSAKVKISVEEMTTEIARLNAEVDLTSLYRLFLRIARPQAVLGFTPKLWSTYVNFAKASAVLNEAGHYIGRGEGFPREFLDWACGCWLGFIPTAIRLAGGKNPRGAIINRPRLPNGSYALELEVHYN